MRMNEYTNLEEFIYEYESGRSIPSDNLDRQKFMRKNRISYVREFRVDRLVFGLRGCS